MAFFNLAFFFFHIMQMGPLSCIIKCKKKMIEMFLPQIQNINKTNGINDYKLEL
jgi:hypothetical protein